MRSPRGPVSVWLCFSAVWLATVAWSQSADPAFAQRLVQAAIERTAHPVTYDGSYRRIDYPGGDVPDHIGVCTDVVIRAYRAVGIDLQVEVHEDMRTAFSEYPNNWGHTRPDSNIDHRRVPNLQMFFARRGARLPLTDSAADYRPGDLVTWMLPGNLPHIGIVTDRRSRRGDRPLVVHNVGAGPELEDVLFAYPITGHYRYPEVVADEPSTLVVRVAGLETVAGKLRVAVFASEEAWLEDAAHAKTVDVDAATVEVTFDGVPPGDYGVAIVHDSNGNGKQDRNFIGIPKEPYGFSNNPARRFGPATWEDAKFAVAGGREEIEVEVK